MEVEKPIRRFYEKWWFELQVVEVDVRRSGQISVGLSGLVELM